MSLCLTTPHPGVRLLRPVRRVFFHDCVGHLHLPEPVPPMMTEGSVLAYATVAASPRGDD